MMQEVEVLKTIPEVVCSYFSEEQFTLSIFSFNVALISFLCIMITEVVRYALCLSEDDGA